MRTECTVRNKQELLVVQVQVVGRSEYHASMRRAKKTSPSTASHHIWNETTHIRPNVPFAYHQRDTTAGSNDSLLQADGVFILAAAGGGGNAASPATW